MHRSADRTRERERDSQEGNGNGNCNCSRPQGLKIFSDGLTRPVYALYVNARVHCVFEGTRTALGFANIHTTHTVQNVNGIQLLSATR